MTPDTLPDGPPQEGPEGPEGPVYGEAHLIDGSALGIAMHAIADFAEGATKLQNWDGPSALSRRVLNALDGEIVSASGHLYRYDRAFGVWSEITETYGKQHILNYGLLTLGMGGRYTKFHPAVVDNAWRLVLLKAQKDNFFDNPTPGLAFHDGFLRQTPEGEYPLSMEHHQPWHRCRSLYEFPLGNDLTWTRQPDPHNPSSTRHALHDDYLFALPTWVELGLKRWLKASEDPIADANVIQEFIGLSLLGLAPRFAKCLFLRGTSGTGIEAGSNGKSTFLKALGLLLPPGKYAPSLNLNNWIQDFHRTGLIGGQLISVWDEVESINLPDIWKTIVTGGAIEARYTGTRSSPTFEYHPRTGLVMGGHDLPKVKGKMAGMARRFLLIDFKNRFRATDPDHIPEDVFLSQLKREIPSIVIWALAGAERALRTGTYTTPAIQTDALREFVESNDPISQFWLDEILIDLTPNAHGHLPFIPFSAIWRRFMQWSQESNNRTSMTRYQFASAFRLHYAAQKLEGGSYDANNCRYRGIRLRGEFDDTP